MDAATQPAVALVLGYDKRYGSGNARGHSDTLMLIRVDPKTKILSLLSLPRDMYVNIPGCGSARSTTPTPTAARRSRSRR